MKKFNLYISIVLSAVMLYSCGGGQSRQNPQGEQIAYQGPNGRENSQWRGEGREGAFIETGLLKAWQEGGPELLWYFEGLGHGWMSAAFANERLYAICLKFPSRT